MKLKKVKSLLIAMVLIAGIGVNVIPVYAAPTTTYATIDTTKTGSLTLHKLIENDGGNTVANGLVDENESRTPIDKIVFSYKKIADIVNVAGNSSVGVYFTNLDSNFIKIANDLNITIQATTINGTNYYTTAQIESAISSINEAKGDGSTYTGETKLNDYVKTGTAMTATDANGVTTAANMQLGLYLVGETDISAHDGRKADGSEYMQSPNPEAPVIDSPASPFLVSLPTTNMAEINGNSAGTVWQYDVDVYPKDQTNSIYKRIVDPDETTARALRLTEDYQIGDTIEQVIYADAPKLQTGKTHEKYVISDVMTEGITFDEVTKVAYGNKVDNPEKESDFAGFTSFDAKDYEVTSTNNNHEFAVELTSSGLKKLDGVTANSEVIVYFNSTLNKNAKIGTAASNENHPTLTWRNSNTLQRSYSGNSVYDYTYELDIQKNGLTDASKATFTVSKVTGTGTTTTKSIPLTFVKETNGVYHLSDNELDESGNAVSEIHPATDGKLYIKGFDSETYTFKETATEAGKNLLKSTFDVSFAAPDPTRTGNFAKDGAVVSIDGNTTVLTSANGIAHLTVDNYKGITLRTGGEGRSTIYGCGVVLAGILSIGVYAKKKKR